MHESQPTCFSLVSVTLKIHLFLIIDKIYRKTPLIECICPIMKTVTSTLAYFYYSKSLIVEKTASLNDINN